MHHALEVNRFWLCQTKREKADFSIDGQPLKKNPQPLPLPPMVRFQGCASKNTSTELSFCNGGWGERPSLRLLEHKGLDLQVA